MKFLILMLFLSSFLFSEGLDSLLQQYEKESDHSKKTKNESAGTLILYTRDDLERMQVESLKDLLKSLRFNPYQENRFGQPDIYNIDPVTYNSKSIRVYLNDNELLTAISGSGFINFGDMEMDFINHVEIYQGLPSFEFGIEPALTVIRLYTKTSEHDEGGSARFVIGSNGTNKQNVYYSNKEENLDYFVYANHGNDNRDTYAKNGETLRRDTLTNRFYGSVSSQNHTVELHAIQVETEGFLGSLIGNVPNDTNIDSHYINLALNSKFMDDTLKLNISYTNAKNDYSYTYDASTPVFLPVIGAVTSLDQVLDESTLTTRLEKKWNIEGHEIRAGVQYRYKTFDLTDVTFNGVPTLISQAYDVEEVYSAFIQDSILLNENHMFTLSYMKQDYKRNGDVDNQKLDQYRVAYVYTNESWVAKTFLSQQEFSSEPYMTVSPHYGNKDLGEEKSSFISQEFSYKNDTTLSKMILQYGKNEDTAILNTTTFTMENSDQKTSFFGAALEFTYFFSQKDKLEFQTSYRDVESPYDNSETYMSVNHTIRMLNTINKFDIFNELTVHQGDTVPSTGYDYSLGVKYAYSKDLHISFKGDNVLNSGVEKRYLVSQGDFVTVPVIEKRFLFSMEYLF